MDTGRRPKIPVHIGQQIVGGTAPVSIQSMTTTSTRDVASTVGQIHLLEKEGVELVRVAVPDTASLAALKTIKEQIRVPLIADIHFSYALAMQVLDEPVDKLRINPGNIGSLENFTKIASKAKVHRIPMRIGVNAGSLRAETLEKWGRPSPEAMAEDALAYIEVIEKIGYNQVVLSLKAADVQTTIKAYRILHDKVDYPLHIGITEAGTFFKGAVKSAVGLGYLLLEGIGDTLRVSLSAHPKEEIRVAREILQATGLRIFGPEVISCPTCGRCGIDLISLVREVEEGIVDIKEPIKIAVMGCAVNGPGEARQADFGIAGGKGAGLVFQKGNVISKVSEDILVDTLLSYIRKYVNSK